jgi:hypothetical protein
VLSRRMRELRKAELMPTSFDHDNHRNLGRIAESLERIAGALELALPLVEVIARPLVSHPASERPGLRCGMGRLVGEGCMLPLGHDGPHRWIADDEQAMAEHERMHGGGDRGR